MKRRRVAIVLAALSAGFVCVATGLFPQGLLRDLIEARLRASVGPRTRLGRLHVVPARLSAEVEDLFVEGASYSVTVPRLRLSLTPGVLLGRLPAFRTIEVDGARIEARPSRGEAPSRPWTQPVVVAHLAITNATLVYRDDLAGGDVTVRGLGLRGSLGTGALELTAAEILWARPTPLTIGPVLARLRVSPLLDIEVDTLQARTATSRLKATGSLGRVGAFAPHLSVEGVVDLEEAARTAGLPASSGAVSVTASVRGSIEVLSGQALVEGRSLALGGQRVESLKALLTHQGGGRGVSTLALDLGALGGRLTGKAHTEGRSVVVELHAAGLDAHHLVGQAQAAFPIEGTLAADLTLRGDLDRSLDGRATLEARGVAATAVVDVHAEATGTVRPSDRSVDLRWTLTADGEPSGSAAARPALGPFAATAAGAAGGIWPPAIEGTLDAGATLLTHAGTESIPLRATFRSRGQAVSAVLDARPLGGTLHAEGEARGAVLDRLALRADAIDLAPLGALRGRLQATLAAKGPLDRLTGEGRVGVEGLAWGALALGPATLGLETVDGRSRLRLDLPSFSLTGEAEIPAATPRFGRGFLILAETPLGPLAPLLPEGTPLEGTLSGRVDYDVPLASPAATRARARVTRLTATSGRVSAEAVRPFGVAFEGGHIDVQDVDLRGPGYGLTLSGRLGADAGDAIALTASLAADLAAIPSPEAWTLSGHVDSQVTLTGTRSNPRASGSVSARDVSALGPSLPAMTLAEARVELRGDTVDLAPASLHLADGSLTLSGQAPLASLLPGSKAAATAPTASLRAEWEGIQAASLASLASDKPRPIAGALSGRAEITGNPASLPTLRGEATLDASDLTLEDLVVHLAPVALRLDSGRLTTPGITAWTDQGSFQVNGSADLAARSMDVSAHGRLELRALSPFIGAASLSGAADVSLTLQGPFGAPRPRGEVWVHDGTVRLRDIPETVTALNGALRLDGEAARLDETTAVVGGGNVRLSGTARLLGSAVSDVSLDISGRGMALRYPPGLRSRIDTDLTLRGKAGALLLAGTVRVPRALYDLEVAIQQGVRAVPPAAASPGLRAIGLDIRVDIENPVLVRNKLASLDVAGSLSFRGDMETPLPFGRLDMGTGGKVYVQGRDFAVGSGSLLYDGSWNPTVSVRASRRIRDTGTLNDYDVTLSAEGPLDGVQPTLSATGLSDAQAFSLVATGGVSGRALGAGARVAGEQAASLLVGRFSRSLGLGDVSVQPELLARETDPGTRFTFGKQLTDAVSLIYSVGLNGPEQRFVQVEGRIRRSVGLQVQRQDDGTVTYGAGQRLLFGGGRRRVSTPDKESVRLSEVRLEGDEPLPEERLRAALRSRPGRRVTPWSVQEDADRLRDRLVGERFIEAEVGARMEGESVVFRIRSGPRFSWRVTGMDDPPDLTAEVRGALFEEEAIDRGRARLLRDLRERGHLRARVSAKGLDLEGERVLAFEAAPGPRLEAEGLFPGASALSASDLLSAAGGPAEILASPEEAARHIVAAYAARDFLGARLGTPQVEESPGRVRITWPVTEGERARVANLRFEGATRPREELDRAAGLTVGSPFDTAVVTAAVDGLRNDYMARGFPRVRVNAEILRSGDDAEVVFHVVEGDRIEVGAVEIVGLRRARGSLVRRRIDLAPGDPLDPRRLAAMERRLMELGIFSRVLVTASDESPAVVRVEVEESARLSASYDLRYNGDAKTTAQVDAETPDLLGIGLNVGGRYRVGKDIREGRGSAFLPSVLGTGSVTASFFHLEEDLAATDPFSGEPFTNVRLQRGFQIQQAIPFPGHWSLLFGYRFKRVSSTAFPEPITIAGLDTSLIQDTRDNPLDARRGRFLSLNISYSPKALASDFVFLKGYAQAFLSRSVGRSWTWAQGYRLGLAHGFEGQSLISSERFYAGGPNSLRGFATEGVGPLDFLGDPTGGEAVAILNQEVRYRHATGLGAALFYDGGNVFATVGDLSFDLRHTVGFGLRWESPVGLLRLDLGFPLSRDAGDPAHRFSFSFGQAF